MSIKNKGKRSIYLLITIVSIILIIHCSLLLVDSMITSKCHFEDYFDGIYSTLSYEYRKFDLETILFNLTVFLVYLFTIVGIFLYRNKKNKGKFNLIIVIISTLLFLFCALELYNYEGEYKHCIKTNLNHSELTYLYKSLKMGNAMIMGYLKVFIPYLFVVMSYFCYRFLKKSN
jgi:hypothetical protein